MSTNPATFPKSWHLLGESAQFTDRPTSVEIFGQPFVAYRGSSGRLFVVDRQCYHMGADLGRGFVRHDRIVCPFHRWEYNGDGSCAHAPGCAQVPTGARIKGYPVEERHGLAFMFNHETALFDLPFFEGLDSHEFIRGKAIHVPQECEWYVPPANAFDLSHFRYVHHRIPKREPALSSPHPYAARIVHDFEVRGKTFADRCVRFLYGKDSSLDFTVWSGNFALAVTGFGRFKNYMLIQSRTLGPGLSESVIFIYAPVARRSRPVRALYRARMFVQALLTKRFFEVESDEIRGVRIDIDRLGPTESMLKDYMNWLASLAAPGT